jgi:hypothetical protein
VRLLSSAWAVKIGSASLIPMPIAGFEPATLSRGDRLSSTLQRGFRAIRVRNVCGLTTTMTGIERWCLAKGG